MILIQMMGLSGSGKSTIATATASKLKALGYKVELLDGDEYRKHLCAGLGFSKKDRIENISRLGFVGMTLIKHGIISILAAINPYEEARAKLKEMSQQVKSVYIKCPIEVTIQRDPKGLYKRALLPEDHPDYIGHFTGISDPFETPENPDLVIDTHHMSVDESTELLVGFIQASIIQK